jgi:hypothetical protein
MRLKGQVEGGEYDDEWADVDEDELTAHLGVESEHTAGTRQATDIQQDKASEFSHSTGSSSKSTNEREQRSSASFSTHSFIRRRVQQEIHHRPVRVRRIAAPFDSEAHYSLLYERIARASCNNEVPVGFGLQPGEAGYTSYHPIRSVQVGQRRMRRLNVTLPRNVWQPRIILWAQGVWELTQLKEELGMSG